jgi:SAM-dependent methyltransferase
MTREPAALRTSIDVDLAQAPAFDALMGQLADGLARLGIRFEPGASGRVVEGQTEVGRVVEWMPGERVSLEWRPSSWAPDEVTTVDLRVEAIEGGTRITLEHRGWGRVMGGTDELTDWFAGEVAASVLARMSPVALGDWMTDHRARRPSGARSRGVYRDPLYHYPNFRVILDELALGPEDHLLEVGCGGGALLKMALESGCRAAAVDHSPEMVRLAREVNAVAVAGGHLTVREARADALPFEDAAFTCATMTGVLGFLPDPVAVFREIRRVLAPGGRFVGLGSDPRHRGTPAAPEPMASRLRFYEPAELESLARQAGFEEARVVRRDLEVFAREAGVPDEHLPLFRGGEQFLVARRH